MRVRPDRCAAGQRSLAADVPAQRRAASHPPTSYIRGAGGKLRLLKVPYGLFYSYGDSSSGQSSSAQIKAAIRRALPSLRARVRAELEDAGYGPHPEKRSQGGGV